MNHHDRENAARDTAEPMPAVGNAGVPPEAPLSQEMPTAARLDARAHQLQRKRARAKAGRAARQAEIAGHLQLVLATLRRSQEDLAEAGGSSRAKVREWLRADGASVFNPAVIEADPELALTLYTLRIAALQKTRAVKPDKFLSAFAKRFSEVVDILEDGIIDDEEEPRMVAACAAMMGDLQRMMAYLAGRHR